MKKGCLLMLILWAGVSFGIFTLLKHGYPHNELLGGSILGGLFGALGLGGLINSRTYFALLSAINSGGKAKPQDGKLFAAVGPIHPISSTIKSPFTQSDVVAYEYDVNHDIETSDETRTSHDYSGFALVPSTIRAPWGGVKLLGFPQLDNFEENFCSEPPQLENARKYFQETKMEKLKLRNALKVVQEMLNEDDGQIRKDYQMSERNDFENLMLKERLVKPGTQVVAIGMFSAAKGGLIPDTAKSGQVVQLFPGDANSAAKKIRGSLISTIIISIVLTLMVAGATFAAWKQIQPGS